MPLCQQAAARAVISFLLPAKTSVPMSRFAGCFGNDFSGKDSLPGGRSTHVTE
jgi:hypothetical protein